MSEEEFKNNVLPFARKLYPMLRSILKDEEETRDALQDLMLKLWRKKNELEKCQHPNAYMVTMAKNYCYDLLKKKRPEKLNEVQKNELINVESNGISQDVKEKYEHVQRIINALPDKYREVIRLRDIDGFSYEEIKEFTGLEVANIRVILSRARQKVREEIMKIYDYEDKRQTTGKLL